MPPRRCYSGPPMDTKPLLSRRDFGKVALAAVAAAALADWRKTATAATFEPVRKKIEDAGIDLRLLCFNINRQMTDETIEYGFNMAKWLGVKAMTTSTQVSVAKRIAPLADKHQM